MIRFVFRFAGLWILAAGFVALVRDGTNLIARNPNFLTALDKDWTDFHLVSRQAFEAMATQHIDRYVGGWLWDPVALAILSAPSFVVLGLVGSILILIGRRKKRLIGYGRD
jgi:hypothetical protein